MSKSKNKELTQINKSLANQQTLNYYTDGSLAHNIIPGSSDPLWDPSRTDVRMGAAFIEIKSNQQFSMRISNWPSSTRAELFGIFLSLLASPQNSTVNIFTDSLCAIQSINKWLELSSTKSRKRLKLNNLILLHKIGLLLKEKNISLRLHKVKGHSGDYWNEEVDKLAKSSLDDYSIYNNNFTLGDSNISFIPTLDDIPIEFNLRKFLKRHLGFYTSRIWSKLKCNQNTLIEHSHNLKWDITWNLLKQVQHFKCINPTRNNYWTFMLKMLHHLLPTGFILKQRFANLYNMFTCQFCKTNEDTIFHYITCTGLTTEWQQIHQTLYSTFKDSIKRIIKGDIQDWQVNKAIQDLLGDSSSSTQFHLFSKSAITLRWDLCYFQNLKQSMKLSDFKATLFCSSLLLNFVKLFKNLIWIPRCNLTVEWEKANGITKQIKHSGYHAHSLTHIPSFASNSIPLQYHVFSQQISQSTVYSEIDTPIVLDDYPIDPPLQSHSSNHSESLSSLATSLWAINSIVDQSKYFISKFFTYQSVEMSHPL